jgi:hypothetical protein
MTQRDRVLRALRMGPVCGTDFLSWHIPRYAARILELRREGHVITTRRCQHHAHDSRQTVYELIGADQLELPLALV